MSVAALAEGRLDVAARARLRELTLLEPVPAIAFFDAFYAAPLAARLDLAGARILDCACGSGWLAAALALRGARVVAADLGAVPLARTGAVVSALGLGHAVAVLPADVTRLPFRDRAFDAVCSIETLEHVPIAPAMQELARVCGRFFVIETINRHFPIDTHDTPYPLVHWLPGPLRSRLHKRLRVDPPNRYPSVPEIERPLFAEGFALATPFKTFDDVDAWERVFPFSHPYQGGRAISLLQPKWRAKRRFYRTVFGMLGGNSRYFLDKIMGIYERRDAVVR